MKKSLLMAAAVLGAAAFPTLSNAALVFDIVATSVSGAGVTVSGDNKTVTYTTAGGGAGFTFDIYARVTGVAGGLEGFQSAEGSLATGGIGTTQVNLSGHTLESPFNAGGSSIGNLTNLGGDSDNDYGVSLTPINATAGNVVYRAGGMQTGSGTGISSFKLGSGSASISSAGSNTVLTFIVAAINGLNRAPLWQEDGVSKNQASVGASITVSGLNIQQAITTTSTDFTLSAAAGSTNVLLGGNTDITSTITNAGTGTDDTLNFTGLNASSGAGGSVTGAGSNGGPLAQSASANNTGLTFTGTAYGTSTVTPNVTTATNATLGGNATNTGTTTVNINVGRATADTDGNFTVGNALTAATGSTLVGLASKVVSGSSVAIESQAIVLQTNDGDGLADGTVSMNWRDRTAAEQQNGNPIFVDPQVNLGSDVVLVSGIGGIYTLRMDYDASDFAGDASEIQAALDGFLYLGYLDAGLWENAGTGAADIDGYSGADFILGKWGVDATNNYVWAVVNHGGEFAAVVPEPASLGVLALGGLALLARRRK